MWVCGSHALVWWHNLNNQNLFVNFPKLQGLLANQVLSHTMQKKTQLMNIANAGVLEKNSTSTIAGVLDPTQTMWNCS